MNKNQFKFLGEKQDNFSDAIPIPRENIYTEKFIKASKEADENIRINKINNARAYAEAKNYFVV